MRKRKLLKSGLASLLAAVLTIGMLPMMPENTTTVYAEEAKTASKTIAGLGTDVIKDPVNISTSTTAGWQGSYVYFGTYNGKSVKYRVLDKNTTAFGGTTMLLDCDTVLWQGSDPSSAIDTNGYKDWVDTQIRSYLNDTFLTKNFTNAEQNAIVESYKKAAVSGDGNLTGNLLVYASLTGEKIFFLDAVEVTNPSYGYSYTKDCVAAASRIKTGGNAHWWLRSKRTDIGNVHAGVIDSNGSVVSATLDCLHGASPALNVNLSSVLFTSAISGSAGAVGTSYKLTILDSALTIAGNGAVTRSGDTVTVPYTITGNDSKNATQVSILLLDKAYTAGNTNKANVIYYGALDTDSFSATGTGTFTIPSDYVSKICGKDYYAYIIAEDVNGAEYTDYASTPVEIKIGLKDIEHVYVTGIEEPAATLNFDTSATCETGGVSNSSLTVTWTPKSTSGKVAYNTPYTASVTLSPASGYQFASDTSAKVDGNDATSVVKNSDGTLTVTYTFNATTENKSITGLGTSKITDPEKPTSVNDAWEGSYVYFGSYNGKPVKYRVLDKETSVFGGTTMLLDCDSILWMGSKFDASSRDWADSSIRKYLNGTFLTSGFTTAEQNAIAYSSKSAADSSDGAGNNTYFSYAALSNDKIFFLDAKEVTNESYGYSNIDYSSEEKRKATSSAANRIKSLSTGEKAYWWLRSPNHTTAGCAAIVGTVGNIASNGVNVSDTGESPAFNVNLSSVLFTSVVSGTAGATGTSYKCTLIDDNMTIATSGDVTRDGDTVTIPYTITGSDSGNATQVSVLILDKEYKAGNTNGVKILYYGALNVDGFAATGTGTFTLPETVHALACGSGYYAYIIAEDVQETALTDYASTPVAITISKGTIDSVEVTDITAPVGGHAFDTVASAEATGLETVNPTVTWKQGDTEVTGIAGYNTAYTASVTLKADNGHEFVSEVNATVNGESATVTKNEDGTITVSYTFTATEKRTVSSIGKILVPNADGDDHTFTNYHTKDCVVSREDNELEGKVTVRFADGESGDLDITWTVENAYNETPGAENTFRWTLPDTYNYAEGVASTGTFTIKNKAATPVTVTALDESFTYKENETIDIKQCFTIDANAGEASYELVSGGTGTGSLEGTELTVTTVGTFKIKLTTAAKGNYAAGEAEALITVGNGIIEYSVSDYTCTYDGEAHTIGDVSVSGNDVASVTYSSDGQNYGTKKPEFTDVGSHPVYYKIEKTNHETVTGTKHVTINAKALTVTADKQEIDFGTEISQAAEKVKTNDGGLVSGDYISEVKLIPSTTVCTDNGTIEVDDIVIKNKSGDVVTANYDITKVPGTLVIVHDESATVTNITASKVKTSYTLGDTLNVDDISVNATCADGCTDLITSDFTTNADKVDMKSAGKKTLTVSYKDHTSDIEIVVLPKNITVTVKDSSKHIGASDPDFSYTADGILEGHVLSGITYTRESGEMPGDYVITASEEENANPNYIIHFNTGKLTIEDHDWSGTWTVKREATADCEGLESTACTVCSKNRTRVIAKTGSTESEDAQKIEKSVEIGNNSTVESAEITSDRDTLKADVFKTESFSEITDPRVWIEVSNAANLSESDKTQFEAKAASALSKNASGILYTDINLYKSYIKDSVKTTTQVTTQLDEEIEISLLVPANMRNTNVTVTRTYQVLRLHGEQVDALPSTYDASTHLLTFKTDRFSTYAIAYADTIKSSSGGSSSSSGDSSSGSSSTDSIINNGSAGATTNTNSAAAGVVNTLRKLVNGSTGKKDTASNSAETNKESESKSDKNTPETGSQTNVDESKESENSKDDSSAKSDETGTTKVVKTEIHEKTEASKTVQKQLEEAVEEIKKVDSKIQEGPIVIPKISEGESHTEGAPVTIRVEIPAETQKENRTFYLMSVDAVGEVIVLEGQVSEDGILTVTGNLDENATYQIIYEDIEDSDTPLSSFVNEGGQLVDTEGNAVIVATAAETSEDAGLNWIPILIILIVVVIGFFFFLLWKRKKEEDEETK